MTKKEHNFIVEYTTKDIMDKLESIDAKIEDSKAMSKKALIVASTALTISIIAISTILKS